MMTIVPGAGAPPFLRYLLDRLAAEEHRRAVAQRHGELLAIEDLLEQRRKFAHDERLAGARGPREQQAAALPDELRDEVRAVALDFVLRVDGPLVLHEVQPLGAEGFRLFPRGNLADGLVPLQVEHRRAVRKLVLLEDVVVDGRRLEGVAKEEDAVHVRPCDADVVGVAAQRGEGLRDAHLLHVQRDTAPRRHAVEVDELRAGRPQEGAVLHITAADHAVASVDLVAAVDLPEGVLLRRVP